MVPHINTFTEKVRSAFSFLVHAKRLLFPATPSQFCHRKRKDLFSFSLSFLSFFLSPSFHFFQTRKKSERERRNEKKRKRGTFSLFLVAFVSSMPRRISCSGAPPPCKGIRLSVNGAPLDHSHLHLRLISPPHGSFARPLRLI